jgi:hypothetical protein
MFSSPIAVAHFRKAPCPPAHSQEHRIPAPLAPRANQTPIKCQPTHSVSCRPARASVRENPSTTSTARSANDAAGRRRAPPKSVPARTTPAQTISDANLARAPDRHEDVWARSPCRAERVGGDNRRGVTGKRRRVGCEVVQHGGGEGANPSPHREKYEETDSILRKQRSQDNDHRGADDGADHSEPSFAQRRAELRLAHDRRGGPGPKRVVELEPKGDVERETYRGPQAQCIQKRWAGGRRGIYPSHSAVARGATVRRLFDQVAGVRHSHSVDGQEESAAGLCWAGGREVITPPAKLPRRHRASPSWPDRRSGRTSSHRQTRGAGRPV